MTHTAYIPDAAYELAYDWLRNQPNGAMPSQLIDEVRRQAWKIRNPTVPMPKYHLNRKPTTNMIISFDTRGLLLSEDQQGRLYAWM